MIVLSSEERREMGEHADQVRRVIPASVGPVRQGSGRERRHDALQPHVVPRPEAMPPELQTVLASRFQHDFSHVRVHTDQQAANTATSMGARAFTHGSSIFFGAGQYDPSTPRGRHLLAHELTHVIQADSASAHPAAHSSDVPALEHEAQSAAAAFAMSKPIPLVQRVARGLSAPLRIGPDEKDPTTTPTFGNQYRDTPVAGSARARVELFEKEGIWYEKSRFGATEARGTYDFVVKDGKIWAVKGGLKGYGHTEAAAGGRVTYAGQVTFGGPGGKKGVITEWNNASGHYAPARYFKDNAIKAGLPENKFKAFEYDKAQRLPQLPLSQPTTGHLDPGGQKTGPTAPESPGTVPAPAEVRTPAVTPAVEPGTVPAPAGGLPETAGVGPGTSVGVEASVEAGLGLRLAAGILEFAIFTAIQLFLDWLKEKLDRAAFERDMKARRPQMEAQLKSLESKIASLRKSGNVYARIPIDVQYEFRYIPDPVMGLLSPTLDTYKTVSLGAIDVAGEQAATAKSQHSDQLDDNRELIHYMSSYSVLIDDSFTKTRARRQAARLERLSQIAQQKGRRAAPPTESVPPAAPPPALLPSLAPDQTPQSFTPLPGAPGPSPIQQAMDGVARGRAMTRALLARGEGLERRLGSNNPPTQVERTAFLSDEEQWRLAVIISWEHFKDHPPEEARAALDELLHDDKYGSRLAQIRAHLGG